MTSSTIGARDRDMSRSSAIAQSAKYHVCETDVDPSTDLGSEVLKRNVQLERIPLKCSRDERRNKGRRILPQRSRGIVFGQSEEYQESPWTDA